MKKLIIACIIVNFIFAQNPSSRENSFFMLDELQELKNLFFADKDVLFDKQEKYIKEENIDEFWYDTFAN